MLQLLNSVFRTGCVWVFTALFWALFLPVYLLTFRRLSPRIVQALIRWWAGVSLRMLGLRVRLINESTLEDQRPRVVVVNHQSALELFWMARVLPPAVIAIGKKEIIYVPIINLVWWAFECIRIDRSNSARAIASIEKAAETIVDKRKSLIIAPEGTRTLDGSFLPFKKGAFYIALQRGIPIYPVVVSGAFESLPKGKFFPKPGELRIEFLTPIETQGLTLKDMEETIQRVRHEMIGAYTRLRQPLKSTGTTRHLPE